MKPTHASAFVVLLSVLVAVKASCQFFPDPKMTKAFESNLEALTKSRTRVFVSDCILGKNEKAILVVPISGATGDLVLVSRGDVYNGAGIKYGVNGPELLDPGGGEWSQRKLHGIADQLSKMPFTLMRPQDASHLLNSPSANTCTEPKIK